MDQTRKQAKLEFNNTPAQAHRRRRRGLGHARRPRSTSRPSRSPTSRSAVRRRCSRWPSSTPRCACSSVARSVRSRPSSTSAPTCCSRSSRPSPRRTTRRGARPEMNDELPVGRLAGQGLLLGRLLPLRRREHPDPRRHRLHVGARRAPVLQAGEVDGAVPRRSDVPPRAARPAHRHLVLRASRTSPSSDDRGNRSGSHFGTAGAAPARHAVGCGATTTYQGRRVQDEASTTATTKTTAKPTTTTRRRDDHHRDVRRHVTTAATTSTDLDGRRRRHRRRSTTTSSSSTTSTTMPTKTTTTASTAARWRCSSC